MTKEQEKALTELVEYNEKVLAPRFLIDYAICLVCEFDNRYGLNKELTDFVEKLYSGNCFK